MIRSIKNLTKEEVILLLMITLLSIFLVVLIGKVISEKINYTHYAKENVLVKMTVYKKYTKSQRTNSPSTAQYTKRYYVKVSGENENFTIQSKSLYDEVKEGSQVVITYSMVYRKKRFGTDNNPTLHSKIPRDWYLAKP